jgi:TonB family protein
MAEESKIIGSKPESHKRIAILLLSAVLHGTGFYVLLHLKFQYKIFPSRPPATVVPVIVEVPVRLPKYSAKEAIPQRPEEPVTVIPGRPGQTLERTAGRAAPGEALRPGGTTGEGRPAQKPEAVDRSLPGERTEPGGAGVPYGGFRLTYPQRSDLNLAKPSENSINDLLKPGRYRSWSDVDFLKYLGQAKTPTGGESGSGGGSGAVAGSASGRLSGPARGSRVVPNIVKYDFTPWANAVVIKIQRNWSLGQDAFSGYIGEVGVTILMSRTGELLASEVSESSKSDLLDQAALKAVRLSAPFPSLPSDFPNSSLEMYLVFQYGY